MTAQTHLLDILREAVAQGRKPVHASFSGGRTSARMVKVMKDFMEPEFIVIPTFANTSREDPRTLDFVHQCDEHFGFGTFWLEAVVHPDHGVGTTHRVVTYESAHRHGEVFEQVIRKYGIPNKVFQPCNRELKLRPMESFRRSLGLGQDVPVAIGIRMDEPRRVNPKATELNILYPLVHMFPHDKQDVLDWWAEQAFDLQIEEFEGNCKGCFKKSFGKHFLQIAKDPSVYDWTRDMEDHYRLVGPQDGPRVMFRGHRDTRALFRLYEEFKSSGAEKRRVIPIHEDSGCSESCEMLPMQHELEFA